MALSSKREIVTPIPIKMWCHFLVFKPKSELLNKIAYLQYILNTVVTFGWSKEISLLLKVKSNVKANHSRRDSKHDEIHYPTLCLQVFFKYSAFLHKKGAHTKNERHLCWINDPFSPKDIHQKYNRHLIDLQSPLLINKCFYLFHVFL